MFSLPRLAVFLLGALAVSAAPTAPTPTTQSPRDQAVAALIAANPSLVGSAPAPGEPVVLTPAGYKAASSVKLVPEGGSIAHVGEEVHILDANGNVVSTSVPGKTIPRLPEETGWVAYAGFTYSGSSPISDFTSTWNVPANPGAATDQTLFLFNSFEPSSYDAIVQPVLQWGPSAAGGGNYWAVASWYLVGSDTYYTNPVQVSVGQSLTGIITLTGSSGSSYNYVTEFTGISGTALTVTGAAEGYWWTETLEVYGVTGSNSFPDTNDTPITGITATLQSGGNPSASWSTTSTSQDGVSAVVNTNSANNGKVTINYPN